MSFLDTESLDSFGLPPNTLPDLPTEDTSGLPTIQPPPYERDCHLEGVEMGPHLDPPQMAHWHRGYLSTLLIKATIHLMGIQGTYI